MEVDSTNTIPVSKQTTPSGMTNMTPDDYRDIFWSMLRDAIDQMLTHPPGSYKPISYEQVGHEKYLKSIDMVLSDVQMYSAVYKCVCKQYSEQLYLDLITFVK